MSGDCWLALRMTPHEVAVDAVLDVGVANLQQGLAGDGVEVEVGPGW